MGVNFMQAKMLLLLAIIATSSLIHAEQTPAIHILYDTPRTVTSFAVQLSAEVLASNTYWEAIGFNNGYCGMQTAGGLFGTSTRLIMSMWHSPFGKARVARVNPLVKVTGFGGEGVGVKTMVDSRAFGASGASKALATWTQSRLYTFHVQSRVSNSGGTEVTMHIYKPEDGRWTFFSSLIRADNPNMGNAGTMGGLNSFLEDFGANRQQRTGRIHGAWYKTNPSSPWQTVTNVFADHGRENGSPNHYVQVENFGQGQVLRYSTGGSRSDGHPNEIFQGPISFKGPIEQLNSAPGPGRRQRRRLHN